jgi:hypothetical protein
VKVQAILSAVPMHKNAGANIVFALIAHDHRHFYTHVSHDGGLECKVCKVEEEHVID